MSDPGPLRSIGHVLGEPLHGRLLPELFAQVAHEGNDSGFPPSHVFLRSILLVVQGTPPPEAVPAFISTSVHLWS